MAELNNEKGLVNELENPVENQEDNETKTFTKEEVDAMLQKEADRRVSEALKKAEKKSEEKIREAQKLAQMNEQEKFKYQLEQKEKDIAERERKLSLMENKNEASKILSEKGLALALVDFVVAEDAETMNGNIQLLERAFKESVKAEVEKRLGSKTPTKNLAQDGSITKEQFAKMSIKEQAELYESQPELYKQLTNC